MKNDKLAAMANQIAGYFQSYPDDKAIPGVAKHIEKFWTPRMRETLKARIAVDPHGVDRLVVAAMTGRGEAAAI